MNVGRVGSFIRDQRGSAQLSLRKLAGLAGVSIPYLSQIERGLRKPSADILQAIAGALRISAETLYVQAGMLEERPVRDVASAIRFDPSLSEAQKKALLQIYETFRDPSSAEPRSHSGASKDAASKGARTTKAQSPKATSRRKSSTTKRKEV